MDVDQILEKVDGVLERAALWGMMAAAASTIAGRRVAISYKAPVTAGLAGSMTVRPDGTPDVRIRPDLPADRMVSVYLHELAHCRLHADTMPRSTIHQEPADTRPTEFVDENPADETAADAQVAEWLRYARKHADPDDHLGIIEALYSYYKTH